MQMEPISKITMLMSRKTTLQFKIIVGYSDSIVKNFFFPEALTRKSKSDAYMEHLL